MDALEKLPGDLQEQSTHAGLPIKEGSGQWHTGIDGSIPKKSILPLKGSPCAACSREQPWELAKRNRAVFV